MSWTAVSLKYYFNIYSKFKYSTLMKQCSVLQSFPTSVFFIFGSRVAHDLLAKPPPDVLNPLFAASR